MKGDLDECFCSDPSRRNNRRESASQKINDLLMELINKEEKITIYKERLKELESAFYYNLEIISERDSELNILEKKINCKLTKCDNSEIEK